MRWGRAAGVSGDSGICSEFFLQSSSVALSLLVASSTSGQRSVVLEKPKKEDDRSINRYTERRSGKEAYSGNGFVLAID